MAESMLAHEIVRRGWQEKMSVASAATHFDEIGNPPHRGTVKKLAEVGVPLVPHRARILTRGDGARFDYIIGMDEENRARARAILGEYAGKVSLLFDYSPHPRAIADPWYTGDFDATYRDLAEGIEYFLDYLVREGILET